MAINHNKLKKLTATYKELFATSVEDAQAKMTEDGLTDAEVFEVSEALSNPNEEAEKPKEKPKKVSNEPKEEKYGEYLTSIKYLFKENSRGELTPKKDEDGFHEYEVIKEKLIREVIITEAQSKILNEQTINSNKGYFIIED